MEGTLLPFLVALCAFHGTHVGVASTTLRDMLRRQLGERGYLALYSAVAIATFAWLVTNYARAPLIELWEFAPWTAALPLLLMAPAAILVIAGLTTPNPTVAGLSHLAGADDPAPGIMRVTRHPLMWGIGLWALSHIGPNGDLASLLFFGSFAALSLGGTLLIDRRKRLLGANWQRIAEVTSNFPFLAVVAGRTRLRAHEIGMLRIVAGLLLFVVLIYAHPLIAGRRVLLP